MSNLKFPQGFTWGVSSSAFQIEGAVTEDGRGATIWDRFCETPGHIADGGNAEVACDHYHRYREDVGLIAGLGVDAYRFSIAWSRIQPNGKGAPNQVGLDFYSRLVDCLLEHGIEPTPTLFHWDLPQALQDAGGWHARDTTARFAEYVGHVADALGDRVPRWITQNETFEHAVLGHALGVHAPGETHGLAIFDVVHHLLLSHGLAVQVLRAATPATARIGIAQSMQRARPAGHRLRDRLAAWMLDTVHDNMHIDPLLLGRYPRGLLLLHQDRSALHDGDLAIISQPIDFLGVNFYNPQYVRAADKGSDIPIEEAEPPAQFARTAMGWPVDPTGLTEVLHGLRKRYGRKLPPVIITENGAAFDDSVDAQGGIDDPQRIDYLRRHLETLHQAMNDGIDVRGYFVWSITDNFEWAEGYRPRFGLVHIDYASGKRTVKASYRWLRDLMAAQA
ncbi:MAG TPA: GH1 family beta-glucosidase [Rhodanobacteraceae bacterium]